MHPEVKEQVLGLSLTSDRPLIISDADEVLVQFMVGLEHFLESRGLYIDLTTFAITGNVRRQEDDVPATQDEVKALMKDFFIERTGRVEAVPGAAEALETLSERAQIVVLTNTPPKQRDARIHSLQSQGIDYPVIANIGPKGPTVAHMARNVEAPIYFLDDIPQHHTSVSEEADHVHRIHFIADPRLAKLIDKSADSHHRIDDWPSAHAHIDKHLRSLGY